MSPARQRGARWFKEMRSVEIALCRAQEYIRVGLMKPDLERDIQRLQTEHAIDDSLIQSLVTSTAQAHAHLKLWTRTMWIVNGSVIGVLTLIFGFAARSFIDNGSL